MQRETQSVLSVPEDFRGALRESDLEGFFLECAYVHRAGYLSWIAATVRPDTRRQRIQQALRRLANQRDEEMGATGQRIGQHALI